MFRTLLFDVYDAIIDQKITENGKMEE